MQTQEPQFDAEKAKVLLRALYKLMHDDVSPLHNIALNCEVCATQFPSDSGEVIEACNAQETETRMNHVWEALLRDVTRPG